jgi:HAD superfamily hydrolase (TIGR01458 family)
MGLDIAEAEVLTPAALAVRHCRDRGYARVALHVAPALREDLAGLNDVRSGDVEAVIVGDLGEEFTYERLNTIFRQLHDGAELVALQRNRVWQREDGLVLDAGPFVVALEYAMGREATVIGKPSPAFFDAALAELGVEAADTAMVGDDVEADVGGALDAGLDAVLVRTGKFRDEAVRASGIRPTIVIDTIVDLVPLL